MGLLHMGFIVILIVQYSYSQKVNQTLVNRPVVNNTRPYSIKVMKYLCVGTPYKRSTLHYCKTVLERNRPTKFNVSLSVPETVNYILVTVKVYYKYQTYQPFLMDIEQEGCEYINKRPIIPLADYIYNILNETAPQVSTLCPHGNRTYTIVWWLEEQYTPKSIPAGDYKFHVHFSAQDGVMIFGFEAYVSVRRQGIFRSMLEW